MQLVTSGSQSETVIKKEGLNCEFPTEAQFAYGLVKHFLKSHYSLVKPWLHFQTSVSTVGEENHYMRALILKSFSSRLQ